MNLEKPESFIRISGCNPNGINTNNLKSQLQQSMDLNIDIQCYSEVNANFHNAKVRRTFHEKSLSMDPNSKSTWSTSDVTWGSEYKPGGSAVISRGSAATRVKDRGYDSLGRWSWQLLNGEGSKEILIISVYQCCQQQNNNNAIITAFSSNPTKISTHQRFPSSLATGMKNSTTNQLLYLFATSLD